MRECRLRDLAIGDVARVIGFEPTRREYRSKLLSMGLTHGTVIVVRNIAPMGDPVHIMVRGFDLSLRKDEADALILHRMGPAHSHGRFRGPYPHRRPFHGPWGRGNGRRHRHHHPGPPFTQWIDNVRAFFGPLRSERRREDDE